MKNSSLIMIAFLVIASVACAVWMNHPNSPQAVSQNQAPPTNAPAINLPPPRIGAPPLPSDWQAYHAAREQTLRDHPELTAEYNALLAEMNQQQEDMDAAMIKADPKVAIVVEKLAVIRKHNEAQGAKPAN
jgi:hypothetical protein